MMEIMEKILFLGLLESSLSLLRRPRFELDIFHLGKSPYNGNQGEGGGNPYSPTMTTAEVKRICGGD